MSWTELRHLVLVAGHAIPYRFDRLDSDDGWFLKHFQGGEGPYYLEHVRAGVAEAAADPGALLVFSGGQSDPQAGPRSEAQGYWQIADTFGWYGRPEVAARATTEEFSLDSFLNLLYGLCRFREATGHYPDQVVVVGWAFKAARFEFHRSTLRYPAARYRYNGANDPLRLEEARCFEALRLDDYRRDPFGTSPELAGKRESRNPFRRRHGYDASCLEIAGLLAHRGPEPYPGALPWLYDGERS
ncbi:MAG: hypothetical protein JNK87_25475 [Bryobacterales bacterium]|nr:hypothetical protein [Bryobacterales bacterium]